MGAHKSNILVSFDSVIDTDIGLMRLIKKDYNTDFFYQGILDSPEYIWKHLLELRPVPNPLYIIMDDETEEQTETMNNIYKQFMEEEYKKILELSPLGPLALIANANAYSDNLISLTVICKSQMEKDILKIKEVKFHEAIISDRKDIYTPNYEVIAEKNVWDLKQYVNLERNTLMIPDYRFNVLVVPGYEDTPLLPEEILEKYGRKNEFKIYNAYALDQSILPEL